MKYLWDSIRFANEALAHPSSPAIARLQDHGVITYTLQRVRWSTPDVSYSLAKKFSRPSLSSWH